MDSGATRISWPRLALVSAVIAAVLVGGWAALRPISSAGATSQSIFAPYVDVTNTPMMHFEVPKDAAGEDVILAFVVADDKGDQPCRPSWGGYFPLPAAAEELDLDRRIEQLRHSGGDITVSFGGLTNRELATACQDPQQLDAAYTEVIDRYSLTSIDLDIEGDNLTDAAARTRRAEAIRRVQQAQEAKDQRLTVWLTLPVSTNGLTDDGFAQVQAFLEAGVELSGVNGMTMNFGGTLEPDETMAQASIRAATELQRQLGTAYSRVGKPLDSTVLWHKVGITPMLGQNDHAEERFTTADATEVNEFARKQGVGLLSMWSLNRDGTCAPPLPKILVTVRNDCSGIDQDNQTFAELLSVGTEDLAADRNSIDEERPPDVLPQDDPRTSPYAIWHPDIEYDAGAKVVRMRTVFEAKWANRGFAPDTQVVQAYETPWRLIGPVLPGDKPAPAPSVEPGTYPRWKPGKEYVAGSRVQVGSIPYQARWWTKDDKPEELATTDSPWEILPADADR